MRFSLRGSCFDVREVGTAILREHLCVIRNVTKCFDLFLSVVSVSVISRGGVFLKYGIEHVTKGRVCCDKFYRVEPYVYERYHRGAQGMAFRTSLPGSYGKFHISRGRIFLVHV